MRGAAGWGTFGDDCIHGVGAGCSCAATATGTEQSLEELDFARSACSAAQVGDTVKLARILKRSPDAVHSDGAAGERGGQGRQSIWGSGSQGEGRGAPPKPSLSLPRPPQATAATRRFTMLAVQGE